MTRPRPLLPEWEEATERRVGIVEQKVDKIMDPETGIYAKLSHVEGRLKSWAIAILVGVAGNLALQLLNHH